MLRAMRASLQPETLRLQVTTADGLPGNVYSTICPIDKSYACAVSFMWMGNTVGKVLVANGGVHSVQIEFETEKF